MTSDIPKWKKDWDNKVEAELGMTRTQAREKLSKDQIIGAFRKIEFGSDPHAKKRISLIEEIAETYTNAYTSFQDPFRDEIDQQIWVSFNLGLLNVPKSRRPKKIGFSKKEKKDSFERFQKSGGKVPKDFDGSFNAKDGTE
jgi:hypothetical protein